MTTLRLDTIQGAIFDFDDTLLDNGPADDPTQWLHSRSRLAAVHEVGAKYGIGPLQNLTPQENGTAFTTAKVHSIPGAIWNIFRMKGMVQSDEVDLSHPLLQESVERKIQLHERLLREQGKEIPGASAFMRALAAHGLAKRLALATSAVRRDIDIFLRKYDLAELFPDKRIISAEKVTSPKPDPQSFELAFQSLNLPDNSRQYVLAFEDNPRGLQSAKAAGLYTCAISTRLKRDDPVLLSARPDMVADSYAEFGMLLGLP